MLTGVIVACVFLLCLRERGRTVTFKHVWWLGSLARRALLRPTTAEATRDRRCGFSRVHPRSQVKTARLTRQTGWERSKRRVQDQTCHGEVMLAWCQNPRLSNRSGVGLAYSSRQVPTLCRKALVSTWWEATKGAQRTMNLHQGHIRELALFVDD